MADATRDVSAHDDASAKDDSGLDSATGSDGGAGDTGSAQDIGGSDSAVPSSPSELVNLINQYRKKKRRPPIAFSPSLQIVAEKHAADLKAHYTSFKPGCNLHSWSDKSKEWTGCCYINASCMHDKPAEITTYPGKGFEVAAAGTTSAQAALDAWKGSAGHHAVILGDGWEDSKPFQALGAAGDGIYWVAWFGYEVDPLAP